VAAKGVVMLDVGSVPLVRSWTDCWTDYTLDVVQEVAAYTGSGRQGEHSDIGFAQV
jgi:hypothetical protein